ncbi:MAG: hypothetical protein WDA60_04280 [Acidimicrobiia bacterium]
MQLRARAAVVALIATALVGGLLTGCGGGSDSERLSRRELVTRAEAVCAAGKKESDRLRAEVVPGRRGEAAAAEIDATLEALNLQIDAFADLRGPASTDAQLERLVAHLRDAAHGLETLRDAAADDDLTVDEAVKASPDVVQQVNRASAQAADLLAGLGFLTCIGGLDG